MDFENIEEIKKMFMKINKRITEMNIEKNKKKK